MMNLKIYLKVKIFNQITPTEGNDFQKEKKMVIIKLVLNFTNKNLPT